MTASPRGQQRLFHVKLWRSPYFLAACKPIVLAVLAGGAVAVAVVPAASAAINKCTGSDGRVVFSDQPCTNSQTQTIIKSAKPTGQSAPREPFDATAARVKASLSPECVALAEKMANFFQDGAGQTPEADVTATVTRYKNLCEPVIRKAVAAEEARKSADDKRSMLDNECQTKKRTVQEAKARPGGVSEANKPALAAVEASIARDCR